VSDAPHDPARAAAALETLRGLDAAGPRAEVVELTQLEGGWARHTYAIDVTDPDREGLARYIGRVRPDDSVLDTDLGAEFEIYRILENEPVPAPRVYGYEPSEDTPFGGPYFLMERISGEGLNVWRRPDRELLEADWEGGRGIAEDFVDGMAAVHRVDPAKLAGVVVERDFRASVARWREIYEDVRLVADPVVEEAYAWLLDNEPAPVTPRLVHGDYRIGNCLVDGGRMTGVLDWELAYIGDPRFDLGYMSLPYSAGRFVSPDTQSPLLGAVAEREWLDRRYEAATGEPVDRAVVDLYAALGALMLFSIMGTGLALYAAGESTDIRAAWSRFVFPGLRADLAALIGW
jgi:aminoglycoside phosphotransferase (APT) family kinase protein